MSPRWREADFFVAELGGRRKVRGHVGLAFGLVQGPYGFWAPVHLPTRMPICPGVEFPTLDLGKAFCSALIPLVDDWTTLTLEQARALSDAILVAIARAAQACQAVNPLYAEAERKAS